MQQTNVLLVYGGGGSEHEVSLVSSNRLKDSLSKFKGEFQTLSVEIGKDGIWRADGIQGELTFNKDFVYGAKKFKVDVVVPCIHGYPGETGDIQSMLEILKIPYIGCKSEASLACFNKITSKLWFNALGIPNTPFIFLNDQGEKSIASAKGFFHLHKTVFIKASSQGSSVGVYKATNETELMEGIKNAFQYSAYILIEKAIKGRELEISAYEHQGTLNTSYPGEIILGEKFYTYEEKYSNDSVTTTDIQAKGLSDTIVKQMQEYAKTAFVGLKLRHLSRIDFFLEGNQIYLNEINTFPGLTPISMFPKMLEANGHNFDEFLKEAILGALSGK